MLFKNIFKRGKLQQLSIWPPLFQASPAIFIPHNFAFKQLSFLTAPSSVFDPWRDQAKHPSIQLKNDLYILHFYSRRKRAVNIMVYILLFRRFTTKYSFRLNEQNIIDSVYPKFHWLRQIAIFGPDSIRNQKGAMANTK